MIGGPAVKVIELHDSFGIDAQSLPTLTQLVRRASLEVCAALSEQMQGASAADLVVRRGIRAVTMSEIAEETGARTLGLVCDVVSGEQVDGLVAAAVARFGRLDGWLVKSLAFMTCKTCWDSSEVDIRNAEVGTGNREFKATAIG